MKDVKPTIAAHLIYLRKRRGLTQAQLAETMNYSDKAVSRWERGDTLPDINVLYELCRYYNITLDDLVHEEALPQNDNKYLHIDLANKIAVYALAIALLFLVATVFFFYSITISGRNDWQIFIWATPPVFLILNRACRQFGRPTLSLLCRSGVLWTVLASVYLQFIEYNMWLVFTIGVPAEIILVLWYNISSNRRKLRDAKNEMQIEAVSEVGTETDNRN